MENSQPEGKRGQTRTRVTGRDSQDIGVGERWGHGKVGVRINRVAENSNTDVKGRWRLGNKER